MPMVYRPAIAALCGLLIGGCSTLGTVQYGLEQAATSSLETSRYGVNAARWEVCAGARIGALMTEFKTPEERAAWELFCETYWKDYSRDIALPEGP